MALSNLGRKLPALAPEALATQASPNATGKSATPPLRPYAGQPRSPE